jgi:hypothetical protein
MALDAAKPYSEDIAFSPAESRYLLLFQGHSQDNSSLTLEIDNERPMYVTWDAGATVRQAQLALDNSGPLLLDAALAAPGTNVMLNAAQSLWPGLNAGIRPIPDAQLAPQSAVHMAGDIAAHCGEDLALGAYLWNSLLAESVLSAEADLSLRDPASRKIALTLTAVGAAADLAMRAPLADNAGHKSALPDAVAAALPLRSPFAGEAGHTNTLADAVAAALPLRSPLAAEADLRDVAGGETSALIFDTDHVTDLAAGSAVGRPSCDSGLSQFSALELVPFSDKARVSLNTEASAPDGAEGMLAGSIRSVCRASLGFDGGTTEWIYPVQEGGNLYIQQALEITQTGSGLHIR